MAMVVAGSNLYDPCGFSTTTADHLIHVSAATTQSEKGFWFIHGVQNGGPIYTRSTTTVQVASSNQTVRMLEVDQLAASAASSPSPNATQSGLPIATNSISYAPAPSPAQLTKLYNASVILNITVYLNAKSQALITGHFADFIQNNKVLDALKGRNSTDIEWVGFAEAPTAVDAEVVQPTVQTNNIPVTMTAGAVSSFVVLSAMSTALGGFIALEATLSGAAVGVSSAIGA